MELAKSLFLDFTAYDAFARLGFVERDCNGLFAALHLPFNCRPYRQGHIRFQEFLDRRYRLLDHLNKHIILLDISSCQRRGCIGELAINNNLVLLRLEYNADCR